MKANAGRLWRNKPKASAVWNKSANIIKFPRPPFYKWKTQQAEQQNEDKKRLRDLEKENARLKKLYAEVQLEKDVLSEAVAILKKLSARQNKTS